MAAEKVRDLDAVVTPTLSDLLYLLADPGGTPLDKKMTLTQLKTLLGGQVVQQVNTLTGAVATGTTVIPYDDTIPQQTEGTEFMTLAITPTSTTNKLRIDVVFQFSASVVTPVTAALFQDATANALAAAAAHSVTATAPFQVVFTHYMTAGTTSATTFKVRAGTNAAGTTTFNGSGGARIFGGVMASSITITEIRA